VQILNFNRTYIPETLKKDNLNELKIDLENINPLVLWGPNNGYLELIRKQFPKVKMVARGSELKVLGDESELISFRTRLKL